MGYSDRSPLQRHQQTALGIAASKHGMRARMMRIVLVTTALALAVSGTAMLAHELFVYRTTWTADLSTEGAILAASTAEAMAAGDRAVAQRNLDALESRRRVVAAAVYSADGQLYAWFVRPGADAPPRVSPPQGISFSGERVDVVLPVNHHQQVIGNVYLSARYAVMARVRTYAGIFTLATLLSLGTAYILSRKMHRSITEPLDAIVAVAHAIVNGSDYSLRAKKISNDEIGIVVDAFNKMLEEVQARTRALGDADRRKDEFLATLAHELRNPLAPIRHAVKLLQVAGVDERQRQWAREVISRQVQRMALLLDDLLDVSRITRGRLDLKVEHVELDALLRSAVETARPLIDAKQHRLRVELPSGRVVLAVDPLRLSQSLSNLLTNAAKYTDAGGRIGLSIELQDTAITMTVKDTGIGIESQALGQVFEMFSQVDSATSRAEGGLGIGLALVKGLIELHGGSIEGSSAGLGLGSTFVIRLPRSVVVETTGAGEMTMNAKVMVADDNRDAADSLSMLLEMNGRTVLVANSGAEALEIAGLERPEAIILDIGMPDLSGYEVARRIRAESWGKEMLLIAVTGWGRDDDKAKAEDAGFNHHLTKPVDTDQIDKLLQEYFCASRSTAAT